jgi:predicted secreted hydrolase
MIRKALVLLLVSGLTAGSGQETWRRIVPPLTLEFPRDHGAHLDTRTEWWYLTGEAADASGREFGFQFTIFRRGLFPPKSAPTSRLRPSQVLAGHVAVVDLTGGRFRVAERVRRLDGALAFASETDLHVGLDTWELRRASDGSLRVVGRGGPGGPSLDLTARPLKPLVLHGDRGVSVKGTQPGNASVYTSWTRLAVEGKLAVDGAPLEVKGEAWFDHEFGTSQLGAGVVGWDWLGLRLDDGRELMVYGLRKLDGAYLDVSGGTFVARDGAARRLARKDFSLEPSGTMPGSTTGARYPKTFRIRVPSEGLDIVADPRLEACELDTRRTTGVVYWEGPVRVKSASGGAPVGRGYMELTGYAESLAGKL